MNSRINKSYKNYLLLGILSAAIAFFAVSWKSYASEISTGACQKCLIEKNIGTKLSHNFDKKKQLFHSFLNKGKYHFTKPRSDAGKIYTPAVLKYGTTDFLRQGNHSFNLYTTQTRDTRPNIPLSYLTSQLLI